MTIDGFRYACCYYVVVYINKTSDQLKSIKLTFFNIWSSLATGIFKVNLKTDVW